MDKEQLQDSVIRNAVNAVFEEEVRLLDGSADDPREEIRLTDDQVADLCKRILLLREDIRSLFFSKYCFHLDREAMIALLDAERPDGRLRCYENFLSYAMLSDDTKRISADSFERACHAALQRDIPVEEPVTTTQKKRKKRQKRILSKVWKSVAAVFIVISAGFLLAFTTNAEFRGKVINWYLTTFRQNSVVQPETDDAVTMEHLREYRPSYMPERYRLVETLEAERWIVYGYQDDEAKMLDITLQIPGVISSIDTQGLEMKTLLFHDEIAYLVTGGEGYGTFVFSVDGIPVLIDGYASPEEMLQIAEGIGN